MKRSFGLRSGCTLDSVEEDGTAGLSVGFAFAAGALLFAGTALAAVEREGRFPFASEFAIFEAFATRFDFEFWGTGSACGSDEGSTGAPAGAIWSQLRI